MISRAVIHHEASFYHLEFQRQRDNGCDCTDGPLSMTRAAAVMNDGDLNVFVISY